MKRFLILMCLVLPTQAWSQGKQLKSAVRDACSPIGKTADGQLVYGLACTAMPAPPPRAPLDAAPAVATEPEVERSGIFGMSYTRKPPAQ